MNKEQKKIKFICLPGGGTSSVAFYKWFGLLDSGYRPCFVDLPGRGLRKKEQPLTDIESITDDLYHGILKLLGDGRNEDYVLFGYCMGSIFLYELYNRLRREKQRLPLHLFIIAADVPDGQMYRENFITNPATKYQFYDLIKGCFPDYTFKDTEAVYRFRKAFVDVLYRKYSEGSRVVPVMEEDLKDEGVSTGMDSFELKECLRLANDLIRILSIDCEVCSQYQKTTREVQKFQCGITCITGSEDIIYTRETMEKWISYTEGTCRHYMVQGGHRILLDVNKEATALFNQELPELMEA